jgi:Transposase
MMSESKEPVLTYAACVGLDWGSQTHSWALQETGKDKIETGELTHTPEALEQWARSLEQRFGGRPVAVALEQTRGAVVYALSQYAHLVLYPVNCTAVWGYRKVFRPSGATDDAYDAKVILELVRDKREHLRVLRPDTPETRTLQFLVERRRCWVDERTAFSNRLTDALRQSFPQILDWFDSVQMPMVCDLLERWPTLLQLKARTRDSR